MDYFKTTFFDCYTPLTEAQLREKLTPIPAPKGGTDAGLAGQNLRLVLDSGTELAYAFGAETLTLSENGAAPIEAPYGARALEGVVLATHLLPGTLRGWVLVLDLAERLCTACEVWFCGFAPDLREVWRVYSAGYIAGEGEAPEGRHRMTNRIEGTGTHWRDDDGREMLYFFPSLIWSSFVELSEPRGGVTVTAPSDYLQMDDSRYIYSRVEQEYSGGFTLEVIDLMTLRHIGVRLGFDLRDALDFHLYGGKGEFTGRCTNLEMLTDPGHTLPFSPERLEKLKAEGRGARLSYRPRFLHKDFTQAEVDEIVAANTRLYEIGRAHV